ncbi:MAG: hypothetical protein V4463_07530 [Pseudomonadota bacterium]
MNDQVRLLMAAIVVAIAAWSFWHYLGTDALNVFSIVALVSVAADNVRLRRKLNALENRH